MIRIYRMWRMVRLVESKFLVIKDITDDKEFKKHKKSITEGNCVTEFSRLKTVLGREYGFNNAMRAWLMAISYGYVDSVQGGSPKQELTIKGEALQFSSVWGLVLKEAESLISISGTVAVIISAIALYVSINKS